MNRYKINVYNSKTDSEKNHIFTAISYPEAYFNAVQLLINIYPLSDKSCTILSDSDMNTWETACDKVYEEDGIDISDIEELDNENT